MNSTELDLIPYSNSYKPGILEGFRALFYLILPSESFYEDVSKVPNYTDSVLVCFISLILLELAIAAWKGNKRKLRINDSVTSLTAGVFSRILRLFSSRSIEITLYIYVHERWTVSLPWDSTATWILTFFVLDLIYYWFHRASHEINIIWASHQTHHSSEDYNLTTALRQSCVQTYWSMCFYLVQAPFIPPAMHLVHSQFNLLFQFWIHTELIDDIGPLEYILNTPSHHRVHHGRNPYCIDKNYAGTLIIWDRMFGTFEREKKDVKLAYGLVHPIKTFNPLYVQLAMYRDIAKRVFHMDGFRNKVNVLIKGPGWAPGKPRLGDPSDLPEVESPITFYDPVTSKWLMAYGFIHYNALIPSYEKMMTLRTKIPGPMITFDVLFFVGSLTCISMLFDQKSYAYRLEFVRCVVSVVLLHILKDPIETMHEFPESTAAYLQVFYLVSALIWILYYLLRPTEKDKNS